MPQPTNQNKSKEEMIKKIYKVIAPKELSFGCLIKRNNRILRFLRLEKGGLGDATCLGKNNKLIGMLGFSGKGIIGHPVMIGDVLDWIEKRIQKYYPMLCRKIWLVKCSCGRIGAEQIEKVKDFEKKVGKGICHIDDSGDYARLETYDIFDHGLLGNLREEKRQPIENQSEECIRFIYSLIQGDEKNN